jgi:hypothetical protein
MFCGEFLAHFAGYIREQPDKIVPVQMLVDQNEVVGLVREPKRNMPEPAWVKVTLAGEEHGLPRDCCKTPKSWENRPIGLPKWRFETVSRVILPQSAQPVGESMLVDAKVLMEKLPG